MIGIPHQPEGFRFETERLILRDWREEDAPAFSRHINTPEVLRWLGGAMDEMQIAAYRARIDACRAEYGHCLWALERKADGGYLSGELLGFCGLKRVDTPGAPVEGEVEVAWGLRQDAWGHGFAREAAEAALAVGFEQFGAERIVALTVVENEPSRRLMRRLGMRRRAEFDHKDLRWGQGRDTIVHVIDREAWAAAQREKRH